MSPACPTGWRLWSPVSAVVTVQSRDEGFGRERRLRSSRDFARMRREGRSASGKYLMLRFVPRDRPAEGTAQSSDAQPAASARVGFIVGKRVGNAVTRNRVRRHLREVMRRRLSSIDPHWDLVLIARPAAAATDSATLAHEVNTLLARAKVLATGSERNEI